MTLAYFCDNFIDAILCAVNCLDGFVKSARMMWFCLEDDSGSRNYVFAFIQLLCMVMNP